MYSNDKNYQRKTLFNSVHNSCNLRTGAIFRVSRCVSRVGEIKNSLSATTPHVYLLLVLYFPATTGVFLIILNDIADKFNIFEGFT